MLSQERREEDFLREVVPSLKNGMVNFRDMADILLNFDKDQTKALQQEIQKGLNSFQQSEAAAGRQLAHVDKYYEELTCKKGKLESEDRCLKTCLANLESQRQAINDSLQNYSQALDRANWNKMSTQNALDECRDRASYNEGIRNAGIGIMFIPILGLIAGSVMVGVGEVELNKANRQAQQAQEEVNRFQNLVNSFTSQLATKKQEKTEQERMIEECQGNIWKTHVSLKEMKSKRMKIAGFQQKLRNAVHFLSVLAGKANVAMVVSSQSVIFLEPLCTVMAEIVGLFYQAVGGKCNQFLQDRDIQMAIQSLQDVNKRVSAITGELGLLDDQFL
ncbi:uncharacterized protein LOC115138996 [Oncorhynchus nerka]|uniref:uncharacterized protein LOC115138996 n=1 Tax=Oncorhynchus nerka TaxID=8023 RepID=UPI0011318BD6|nr:uncharacterized protein LOC115138996 [Oncorhynchus nerka]